MSYSPNYCAVKGPFIEALPGRVAKLAKLIGNGNYLLGCKVSYLDFLLLEVLERLLLVAPDCLCPHPNLTDFHARILALPGIAKYRSSCIFQKTKTRFNAPSANIGAGVESYS